MSMGYGGWCSIEAQDEQTVVYQYGSYNLNDPQYSNPEYINDGIITIDKSSLVEPETHEKIKRFPNAKRKRIVKRVAVDVPYLELFENGKIQIRNSANCWKTTENGSDYIAWHLIRTVFLNIKRMERCLKKLLSMLEGCRKGFGLYVV